MCLGRLTACASNKQNDFQDLVDGMMQQLLSKDIMYEPMKQICERVRADWKLLINLRSF